MSFYGIVMMATLLILSLYLGAFLGEMYSASGIAGAYSVVAARVLGSVGAPAPLPPIANG